MNRPDLDKFRLENQSENDMETQEVNQDELENSDEEFDNFQYDQYGLQRPSESETEDMEDSMISDRSDKLVIDSDSEDINSEDDHEEKSVRTQGRDLP